MTAGRGVVHSERTPDYLEKQFKNLHGLQIWVALPKEYEEIEPSFQHIEASAIPYWREGDLSFRLIAGTFDNYRAPVNVYSELYLLEITADTDTWVDLNQRLYGECGLYILEGVVHVEEQEHGAKQILVREDATMCSFEMKAGSKVYLFGGYPFPEERFIYWNFVSSDKEKIEQAKQDWKHGRFPMIEGEDDIVPLPE